LIVEGLTTITFVHALPPIFTAAPGWNPAPEIAMLVPPKIDPEAGVTEFT
jgi:hypothetical protein